MDIFQRDYKQVDFQSNPRQPVDAVLKYEYFAVAAAVLSQARRSDVVVLPAWRQARHFELEPDK